MPSNNNYPGNETKSPNNNARLANGQEEQPSMLTKAQRQIEEGIWTANDKLQAAATTIQKKLRGHNTIIHEAKGQNDSNNCSGRESGKQAAKADNYPFCE